MRTRLYGVIAILTLAAAGLTALSLTQGQDRTPPVAPPPTTPAPIETVEIGALPLVPATAEHPGPDVKNLPVEQKQKYDEARAALLRGTEWLTRMNGVDGRFAHGQVPALGMPMQGEHYLRELGATFALARAARFTGEPRYAALATHAVVRFLDDTSVDAREPQVRYPSTAPAPTNRLGAASLLVLAIHELPLPQADLLEKSDQLCNFIRRHQLADGSLNYNETAGDAKSPEDQDGINHYPGMALYALMRSQQQRPAPWKTDVVRKALPFYQSWWRAHKDLALVTWQTGAFTEAYLLTKEQPFAACVHEMNEWLCSLQYDRFDPRHPEWWGGFKSCTEGTAAATPPQIHCAAHAAALAEACRVARQAGDVQHYDRYKGALELCLQFVSRLQYTEANTQHFVPQYRRAYLLGGFHASPEDGNLRIDYTQQAVCALVQYLTYVAAAG